MEVCFEVHKIIKFTIYNTAFFTPDGGFYKVLVRLQFIKNIFKDSSSMCISFNVKHPQTFWES